MPAQFTFHDIETAPERSKPILNRLLRETGSNGFYAVMAESPEALSGYNALSKAFNASSLTDEEKTVVWQTINVEHECNFCVPAHTAMAKRMMISEIPTTIKQDIGINRSFGNSFSLEPCKVVLPGNMLSSSNLVSIMKKFKF